MPRFLDLILRTLGLRSCPCLACRVRAAGLDDLEFRVLVGPGVVLLCGWSAGCAVFVAPLPPDMAMCLGEALKQAAGKFCPAGATFSSN